MSHSITLGHVSHMIEIGSLQMHFTNIANIFLSYFATQLLHRSLLVISHRFNKLYFIFRDKGRCFSQITIVYVIKYTLFSEINQRIVSLKIVTAHQLVRSGNSYQKRNTKKQDCSRTSTKRMSEL